MEGMKPGVMTATVVMSELALVLTALSIAWWFALPSIPGHLDLWAVVLGVLATLPTVGAMVAYQDSTWPPAVRLTRLVEEELQPMFAGTTMVEFWIIGASAGLGEELLFRGVMQGGLELWLGPASALVLASLGFGLMHAMSAEYVVAATVMGLWWGVVYLWSGNLMVPIVAHALHDVVALWMLCGGERAPAG